MNRIAVVAHRGASDSAPENTLPALAKAKALGADAVAFDVQGTSDGEPILFADTKLERTTNGKGRVARATLEEIRRLDAGSWFKGEFVGTQVPTLEDALKAVQGPPALHILLPEIKAGSKLEARLLPVLSARKARDGDCLFFQDSDSLQRLRGKLPGYAFGMALDARADGWLHLEKAKKLGLNIIRPNREHVSGKLAAEARAATVKVFAFFVDEEKDIRETLALGVDGIYTHRVERLKSAMAAWQKETGTKG